MIKTQLGYHIILVEDRKDSYETLKDDIVPIMKNEKYIEKISDLKDKADIEVYMEKNGE